MDKEFLQESSKLFRLWKSGKKPLWEMTDGELTAMEEYLQLFFLGSPAVVSQKSVPRFPKLRKIFFVVLGIFIFLMVFFSER